MNKILNITDTQLLVKEGYNPHLYMNEFINNEYYKKLLNEFPSDDLFTEEQPKTRKLGQRPHCRRFMCITTEKESSYFDNYIIDQTKLPMIWQELLTEIKGEEYRKWICDMLQIKDFRIRFDFHRTESGLDVSPHVDSVGKYASHLLYFMPEEWNDDNGGSTIFYSGKTIDRLNPEPTDFKQSVLYPVIGNSSLLFKNVPDGWHGITEVKANNMSRQLCNVVILKK